MGDAANRSYIYKGKGASSEVDKMIAAIIDKKGTTLYIRVQKFILPTQKNKNFSDCTYLVNNSQIRG